MAARPPVKIPQADLARPTAVSVLPAKMPFERLSAEYRELTFREQLRGRRLAFEVGLTEEHRAAATLTFAHPLTGHLRFSQQRLQEYPATLVMLLASSGVFLYDKSGFWPKLGLGENESSIVGKAFEAALRQLRLATFQEVVVGEKALRYLTPILAHGGIPNYSLNDFFGLLVKGIRHGATEAADMISLWRARKSLTQWVDRPVLRFLMYGGDPAADFLQRCIDMALETGRNSRAPDATEVGLPERLVQAFDAFGDRVEPQPGRTLPRPRVQLDPWDGMGPTLELPAGEDSSGDLSWRFQDERRSATYHGSRNRPQTIRLFPARRWNVELRTDGQTPRTFVFECLEPLPVLFFDPNTGRLCKQRDNLRLPSVWTLHPNDVRLRCIDGSGVERQLAPIEELPQPGGAWSAFTVGHWNLENVRYLVVQSASGNVDRIPVAAPGARPALVGVQPVPGIATFGGAQLYPDAPALQLPELPDVTWDRWRVSARSSGAIRSKSAADLPRDGGLFSLLPVLEGWQAQEIDLAVRGPLGSDLSVAFAVVPDLQVELPRQILMPRQSASVRITAASSVQLGTQGHAGSATVHVRDDAEQVLCMAVCGQRALELRITVPRLRWALSRANDSGMVFDSQLLCVGTDDIANTSGASFVVSTGVGGVPMRLQLVANGNTLQCSDWNRTSWANGRLFVDLARFRDSLLHSGSSSVEFLLELSDQRVRVVRVVTTIEVSNICVRHSEENGQLVLECTFAENRSLHNREVRFWSLDRPWDDALVFALADDAPGRVSITGGSVPSVGRYLVEVGLSDRWTPPHRPRLHAKNSSVATVGEPEAAERRRTALDQQNPANVLEILVTTGRLPRNLEPNEVLTLAPLGVEATSWLLANHGTKMLSSRSFQHLLNLFGSDLGLLMFGLAGAAERGRIGSAEILALALTVIPLIKPPTAAPADSRLDEGQTQRTLVPELTDSMIRSVWGACPPVAALWDIRGAAAGDAASTSRCEEWLGVVPPDSQVAAGEAVKRIEWVAPADRLREIQRAAELKPIRLLDLDAFVEADLEWLLAEREQRLNSADWVVRYGYLQQMLSITNPQIDRHLAARRPSGHFEKAMELPRVVLAAALHIVASTPYLEPAVQALLPLVDVVPKLVSHDLVLAALLVATTSPDPFS